MMKNLVALILLSLAAGAAPAADPSMGSHGMLLFGGPDALYASHLPMFHPPHDYQVILQVRLADKAQDAALRKRLDNRAEPWTLDPEKFQLDRLAPGARAPLTRFKANLVQGHFEQGGKTEYTGAGVLVEKVLYFRQLSALTARAAAARYLQLGTGKQRFLVKQIDTRPDFDHVLAAQARPRVSGAAVVVPKTALQQSADAAIMHAMPGLEVKGTVYFSTQDLR